MAENHGVTHEQLAKQLSDLGVMVETIRSHVSAMHAQTAVLVSKIEAAEKERATMRVDIRDLRTAHDQRTGAERVARWLIGIGTAIASGGAVAWIAGLFSSGRGS